jgi:hypothetical protein
MKGAIIDSSKLFTGPTSGLFGDANNILEANIMGYYLAGSEDAAATLDEERRNQVIEDAYKAQYQRLAVRAKEVSQSSGLEIQDARKLVSDAFIVSIVTGMEDSDFKDFNPDADFLGFEGFQNTLILIADAEREENTVEDVKMEEAEYSVFATNVIGEIAYEEDDTVVEKLQKKRARELIGRSNRFLAQKVNLNAVNPETRDFIISDEDRQDLINTLALTGHELAGDNTISVGDLVAHWNAMSIMEGREGAGEGEGDIPVPDGGSNTGAAATSLNDLLKLVNGMDRDSPEYEEANNYINNIIMTRREGQREAIANFFIEGGALTTRAYEGALGYLHEQITKEHRVEPEEDIWNRIKADLPK